MIFEPLFVLAFNATFSAVLALIVWFATKGDGHGLGH